MTSAFPGAMYHAPPRRRPTDLRTPSDPPTRLDLRTWPDLRINDADCTRAELVRYFAWGYLSRRELNERLRPAALERSSVR